MYSRALRRVFALSAKVRDHKELKNVALVPPSLALARQQLLACTSLHTSAQRLTKDLSQLTLPKDADQRRLKIDRDDQKELDRMLEENPELEKKMEIVKLEMSVMQQSGLPVPEVMRPGHWLEVMKTESKNRRIKYFEFLFKIEKKNENRKAKQEKRNKEFQEHIISRNEAGACTDVIVYSLGNNSMFRRITENSMNKLWTWNSLKATMWGNKIVFDFSYEQYMRPSEIKSCAKQIMESYAINRTHKFVFDVYLCNVNFNGPLFKSLVRFIPNLLDKDFPWTITSKSFMELFDKKSIVYLSGQSNEVLEKYDHSSVYIIGAFVDKSYSKPVSLGIAKELGVRCAKLPIDKYLHFGDGSNKNLTLNQVTGIMLDVQCNDWETALQHIPRRKLFESRVAALERKMQRELRWSQKNNGGEDDFSLTSSSPTLDFSHSARIKMRQNYRKEE